MEEFLRAALDAAGLDGEIEKYVEFDQSMIRPAEVELLIGDASKAKKKLSWSPKVNFQQLVEIMVTHDLSIEKHN